MTTIFNMTRDINGFNGFGLEFADDNQKTTLAVGVEQHFTVSSNYSTWLAVFSFEPGSSVWVANNETAAVPSGSFSSTDSQLNPSARKVFGGDVLSFISNNTTAEIGVSLYAIS